MIKPDGYTGKYDAKRGRFFDGQEEIAERRKRDVAARREMRRRIPPDWLAPLEEPFEEGFRPCVYFVQAEDGGPVKIGTTFSVLSVASRLKAIQTGSPKRLVVRRIIEGNFELPLHKHFGHLRIRGEWFEIDEELAELIAPSDPLDSL